LYLGYIHYFRALAIFFIVAGHSIDIFTWENSENIEKILRVYISNGSVLFVFIAGYLFQHLSHKYEIKKYYKSKFKNVLVPYFLISIPAIFVFVTVMERETMWLGFYDNPTWLQVVLFYLTGKHLAPLWFIPMIAIFYLIAPLLIKADKGNVIYYGMPVFIILSCVFGRGDLPNINFIHFFSVYLLGMACSKYKDELNSIFEKSRFLCITFAIVVVLGLIELFFIESTMSYVNYLQKITMSVFFLGLLIRYNSNLKSKLVSVIANTSFGIFFIHSYIITGSKLSYKEILGALPQGNLFVYLLAAIATLLVCTAAILFIKKISGRNSRYLVGS